MTLLPWISAIHDNTSKITLLKAYVPLLGAKATTLLMHLCNTLENEEPSMVDDGLLWHKQNIEWMAFHSSLSQSSLRRAKQRLVEYGLVHVRQEETCDRTTFWRVDTEKLSRFFAFSHALRNALRPDNTKTLPIWHDFVHAHPEIVEEFRCMYERINQYMPEKNLPSPSLKLKEHASFQKREMPVKRPCRFIEHWNKQVGVPKCKLGTKQYEAARKFFIAHRKFLAGHKLYVLNSDEQERIQLEKVNRIPLDAPRGGRAQVPLRTDAQMFQHIERAALAYHPDFTPVNKQKLPKSLPAFLYNTFSKIRGISSLFLERLIAFVPQPIDEVSIDAIWAGAALDEQDTVAVLKRIFDMANNRDVEQSLSLRDLKAALSAARRIIALYMQIPLTEVPIFASHFGQYNEFLERFEMFVEDQVWEGMPMSALHPSKDIWRRFVDFVSDDIGYHLFTGERL